MVLSEVVGESFHQAFKEIRCPERSAAKSKVKGVEITLEKSHSNDTMSHWFYILRLKSGALYVGHTCDIERRLKEHLNGSASRTTRIDPVESLVYTEQYPFVAEARKRESKVKRWTKAKKEALIAGDLQGLKLLSRSKNLKK